MATNESEVDIVWLYVIIVLVQFYMIDIFEGVS